MAVITISRGTFSGGRMLAECLCRRMGYRNIDRDAIVERAATPRISQQQLRNALEEPPGIAGRFHHKRYLYLSLIQAALAEEACSGNAVYHGLAGHLLLRGVPGILRLRIIAPLEHRIEMAREQLGLCRAEAVKHIEEMDQHRRRWTRYLYNLDWNDPALYDFIVNLEQVSVESACRTVAAMVELQTVPFTADCRQALCNLAVASRIRANLAVEPLTAELQLHVESRGGSVTIQGDVRKLAEEVRRIAQDVPGVTEVSLCQAEATDEAWPWSTLLR